MLKLCLGLLTFFFNLLLLAESYEFKIGFIDYKEDIRYSDWGRHPVDIRSKQNEESRSVDGAILAIDEAKRMQRITKTKISLIHLRLDNKNDFYNLLMSNEIKKYNAILLDIPLENLEGGIEELSGKISHLFSIVYKYRLMYNIS